MSEMIDRVIKAINTWEVVPDTDRQGRTWWHVCEASTRSGERYRDYVRAKVLRDQLNAIAVIKAMREPTEAMMTAGWAYGYDNGTGLPSEVHVAAHYRAMIDAALKE